MEENMEEKKVHRRYYPGGHFVRSTFWKNYKKSLPIELPENLLSIAVGVVLGDASLYKTKTEGTLLKFEVGFKHKNYIKDLHAIFKKWTFYKEPSVYIRKKQTTSQIIKSYHFRTFAHPAFNILWNLFMNNGKKHYQQGIITQYLSPTGFSYWVADDGSLAKNNELILHTQSFGKQENIWISEELNQKFSLHSRVIPHKKVYHVVYIPASDAEKVRKLLKKLPIAIKYKLPRKIASNKD